MITFAEYRDVVPYPAPAQTLAESGLPLDLVVQLTLKSLHFGGELAGTDLSRRLGAESGLVERLLIDYYGSRGIALRACHPGDLIRQALSLASYLNRPPHLTMELLEAACDSYFVNDVRTWPSTPDSPC
jgi:hypothetical protein